jgi:hypothetical protein
MNLKGSQSGRKAKKKGDKKKKNKRRRKKKMPFAPGKVFLMVVISVTDPSGLFFFST